VVAQLAGDACKIGDLAVLALRSAAINALFRWACYWQGRRVSTIPASFFDPASATP